MGVGGLRSQPSGNRVAADNSSADGGLRHAGTLSVRQTIIHTGGNDPPTPAAPDRRIYNSIDETAEITY